MSKPIVWDKNKKNISKCHVLLLVSCFGASFCGANCLEANSVVSDVLSEINDK